MILDMLDRWKDLAKPLSMIPKDFRDRILIGVGITSGGQGGSAVTSSQGPAAGQMHREVRLNYMKWLKLGLEIDMFEMLCLLILYSRCDLHTRLELIFELFCYNEETYMQKGEFKFMMNKLCNGIGSTIQIKKSFL